MSDPRSKNEVFDARSAQSFFAEYCARLGQALAGIDGAALARLCETIERAGKQGGHIYAIGNGGSAAIADHLCCDWTKGTDVEGHRPVATTSLSANGALYSAIANDFGFADVFARQLAFFAQRGDVLLAISSSGNSANILNAVERAKTLGMTTCGLTGFSGGRLKEIADISIHVAVENYGVVEDAHQAVMHVVAQFLTARRLSATR
jgi:phosphoheptose isomerase